MLPVSFDFFSPFNEESHYGEFLCEFYFTLHIGSTNMTNKANF